MDEAGHPAGRYPAFQPLYPPTSAAASVELGRCPREAPARAGWQVPCCFGGSGREGCSTPGYPTGRTPGSLLPCPSDSRALGTVTASVPCCVAAPAQRSAGHHPAGPRPLCLAWVGTGTETPPGQGACLMLSQSCVLHRFLLLSSVLFFLLMYLEVLVMFSCLAEIVRLLLDGQQSLLKLLWEAREELCPSPVPFPAQPAAAVSRPKAPVLL